MTDPLRDHIRAALDYDVIIRDALYGVPNSAINDLVERLAEGMATHAVSTRPAKAAAMMAAQRFLDAELGRTDYPLTVIPDGENGWAFWVLENDTTGYVHEDLSVEWYGTQWPDDEVTP